MIHSNKRKLKLAAYLTGAGYNQGSWRHSRSPSDATVNFQHYKKMAQIAEAGMFDFAFVADSSFITKNSTPDFLTRFEPITILSALAAVTERLGLVGTMSTSFSEPFTTARQLASLDKLSGGRAGWNAVTSAMEGHGRNYGHEKLHEHSLRYRIANEYIQVVKGLWDSWEDDAFIRNKANGIYADLDKMHTLNHRGEFFRVQGPLNIERSNQGRPIVFQAGGSEEGRDLAAREADGIYSPFRKMAEAKAFSQDIKRRAVSYGRSPDEILIFPSITPIIGQTMEEAERKYEETCEYVDIYLAVQELGITFGEVDFSQYPLDEPLPDLGNQGDNGFRTTAERLKQMIREENLTLRQLALRSATPKGEFVGTPSFIADKIQELYEEGSVDGFVIWSYVQPHGLQDFVEQVVPILQARGLFRKQYEHDTLRGNLGLGYPVNRYI